MPPAGTGVTVASGTRIGCVSSFSMSITSRMRNATWLMWADVGVLGPLHPYRGLGDVVQDAAHLVLVTVHSCDVSLRALF